MNDDSCRWIACVCVGLKRLWNDHALSRGRLYEMPNVTSFSSSFSFIIDFIGVQCIVRTLWLTFVLFSICSNRNSLPREIERWSVLWSDFGTANRRCQSTQGKYKCTDCKERFGRGNWTEIAWSWRTTNCKFGIAFNSQIDDDIYSPPSLRPSLFSFA